MKTILVKVNNASKTIEQVTIMTEDGVPAVIQAQDRVNYEFYDNSAQSAPSQIIAKRINNNLHMNRPDFIGE